PSSVNYMHLVDQARVRIEEQFRRPLSDRLLRRLLALVLPSPKLFRASLRVARLGALFMALFPTRGGTSFISKIKAMVALAPRRLPTAEGEGGRVVPAIG